MVCLWRPGRIRSFKIKPRIPILKDARSITRWEKKRRFFEDATGIPVFQKLTMLREHGRVLALTSRPHAVHHPLENLILGSRHPVHMIKPPRLMRDDGLVESLLLLNFTVWWPWL
jgi:hypothetical protein